MGCGKFDCRKQDICEEYPYNCEGCDSYRECDQCMYEDDDVECPVANAYEHMDD